MAIKAYTGPGVTVTESVNPSVAPLLANPSVVAIIGSAKGYQSGTERLLLSQAKSTLAGSHSLPLTTITVASTAGFDVSGPLEIGTQSGSTTPVSVTYTGKTATTFTGASGGTGTWGSGTVVRQQNVQPLAHTGITSSSVVVTNASTGVTINGGAYVVTQGTDPDSTVTGDEPYTLTRVTTAESAPTLAAGSGTGLTGDFTFAVSFTTPAGETGVGTESTVLSITNKDINLSAIPLGPPNCTARNLYRKHSVATGGDGLFHLAATINNNTGTTLSAHNVSDGTVQAAATPVNGIAPGDTVALTYTYTDRDYYEPTIVDNLADAIDKYGNPYDQDGNVDSELTFAARLAFLNGASELMLVASSATDSDNAIATGLAQLVDEPDVRIVVAARGTDGTNSNVASHVSTLSAQGFYRLGIVGSDGSTTVTPASTLRSNAKAFNQENLIYVSPSSFKVENAVTGRTMNVGGHFAAAAIAGMLSARDVQIPLTRKNLAGFLGYNDKRTQSDLALDSAAGLLVVQQSAGGVLTVRHGVTTNVGSVNTREISVVRAKYDMAQRLRDSLDSSVVGIVVRSAVAPTIVAGAVIGVLEALSVEGTIDTYSGVSARLLQGDPTTVEVRFQYSPAYPINNINVVFTINTNTGDFTLAT